ncbi:NAD(+) diphosphatase [Ornithinimicrobium sp. Y1847]|uniref:NAD(+) diphosphatase n=1 Tax=Ornithinimicrobium sp. Y1847 TaxID=3405419 RepID=UPI003B676567
MSPTDETLLDLALSRTSVDRSGHERADRSTLTRALESQETRVLVLRDGRAPITRGEVVRLALRAPRAMDAAAQPWFLGRDGTRAYLAIDETVGPGPAEADADSVEEEGALVWRSLRDVGAELDDLQAGLLTTATALAGWHGRHQHCPRCGARTEVTHGGWVRRCPKDGSEHYPRTDPAVIMAVIDRQDRILLGTGIPWPDGRVSVLAGFVEAGESMEAAVVREVREEVGIEITDLQYRGNQPWPFPASLMLGFRATATTTDLAPDPEELRCADWFTREQLEQGMANGELTLPSRTSIARRLIEEWFGDRLDDLEQPSAGGVR